MPARRPVIAFNSFVDLYMAVVVDRRRAADDEELFGLYEAVFGARLTEGSKKRWRWQYLENPWSHNGSPQIWVAREGKRVLGQYASMPVRLWWGGREIAASWGMDVFLRPEARGQGIGALLFATWSDAVDVALGLGLTPSSYGLFKKLRYTDVGPVPFFQKILDPKAVLGRRLGSLVGALGAPLLSAGLRITRPSPTPTAEAGIDVRPVQDFTAEYDQLWERARDSFAMCVRRDAPYLRWKYLACPSKRYDVHEARRGDDLRGFVVSRTALHEGLRLGWILDVFAPSGDRAAKAALLTHVLERFAADGVARAQAFAMDATLASDLRAQGFRSAASPMQFCVRSRVENGDTFDRLSAWHVVFGDSDMDR